MNVQLSFAQAVANVSNITSFSRWASKVIPEDKHLARHRFADDVIFPSVQIGKRLKSSENFYAIGSCFAREIERALTERNMRILSRPGDAALAAFRFPGYLNRYTPLSMLNDIASCFGIRRYDGRSIVRVTKSGDDFVDLHSNVVHGPAGFAEITSRRAYLEALLERMRDADAIILTLGLIEAWFDNENKEYINLAPVVKEMFSLYRERFEFHVLSYEQCMAALEEILVILKAGLNRIPRIIVTVSPVPLLATYSGQDILVANTHSKSVLRACAGTWSALHPDQIVYFPSYEMAMLSKADTVWQADRAHVRPEFVRHITDHFINVCLD